MTKKDYELIAGVLHDNAWRMTKKTHASLSWRFMAALSETNPKFDRKRFLQACGVEA